jgi:CheY-like chemotaxis protein
MATPPHILIIDDNVGDINIFRMILEGEYSVSDSHTGKLGLRAIQNGEFDLVILDISMPEVDGFEVLKAIRNDPQKPKILVVSGFIQGSLLGVARMFGADLAISKQETAELLLPSVKKLLENTA